MVEVEIGQRLAGRQLSLLEIALHPIVIALGLLMFAQCCEKLTVGPSLLASLLLQRVPLAEHVGQAEGFEQQRQGLLDAGIGASHGK